MQFAFASDLAGYLVALKQMRRLNGVPFDLEDALSAYYCCAPNIGKEPANLKIYEKEA